MSLPPFSYPTSARNVENPIPLLIKQGENVVDFQRNRHDPPKDANAFSLETATNVDPGPYFPLVNTTNASHSGFATPAPKGSKLCYWREFGSQYGSGPSLAPIFTHYSGLYFVPNAFHFVVEINSWKQIDEQDNTIWYHLVGRIWVLNVARKPVCTRDENGLDAELMTVLGFKWPILNGVEDVVPSFEWKHIAAILRHGVKVSFKPDGSRWSDEERDFEILMHNRNMLRQFGYNGWPRIVGGKFVDSFSRI
ncbi:uncharacterized protein PAC_13025 [Phialocephala subalpina]|uniref:Uncharacterized protein n=1 Tax=Phialocephala subalpina TaxID=576137 RepID=A0A1L7XDN9_9HELO|nr:uncharacterized protein PAC_13025 [Phialocephala subalpina]